MHVHSDWLLTPQRAAIHLPTATTVIADVHLGYSEARRRGGEAVPLPNCDSVLLPLAALAHRYKVHSLVVAGDLFEERQNEALWVGFLNALNRLGLHLRAVIPGNHDRNLRHEGGPLAICADGFTLGRWKVVHGDGCLADEPLVLGHFHPCVRKQGQVHPCFLVGPDRILLPAFSRDAAGVNLLRDPSWRSFDCYPIVGNRVVGLPRCRVARRVK
jgi:putative SbcD/Mre11-related phosphoesterase